jgi:hypothetical protein
MKRSVRWGKWFGERLLWALLLVGPPLVLVPGCLHEIDFHLHASLVTGKVLAYGVEARGDGGGGMQGSFTTIRQWPWLDVVPLHAGEGPPCRIDSQTRIFGDQVSTEPAELQRRLAQIATQPGFAYYALPGATPADNDCRMLRRTDPYTLLMVAFMVLLAAGMAWWAWRSLDDPDFLYEEQQHD